MLKNEEGENHYGKVYGLITQAALVWIIGDAVADLGELRCRRGTLSELSWMQAF